MKKIKSLSVLSACLALVILISNLLPPFEALGAYSDKVKGLVFWGTSSLARVYEDMSRETYDENGNRKGGSEVAQHGWAFNASNYDYKNNGNSSSLGSYWVNDTDGYISGFGNMSKQGVSLSGNNVNGGNNAKSVAMVVAEKGWEPKKTMIVLWAGEDWVTMGSGSNADALEKIPSSASALEKFMGLDIEGYNKDDKDADYASTGEQLEKYHYGTKDGSPHHHEHVWDNSYYACAEGEYPSYSYAVDGIDLTVERELSRLTDPYGEGDDDNSNIKLASYAATTYGRALAGYDYQYEELEQDFSKIPHGGEGNTEIEGPEEMDKVVLDTNDHGDVTVTNTEGNSWRENVASNGSVWSKSVTDPTYTFNTVKSSESYAVLTDDVEYRDDNSNTVTVITGYTAAKAAVGKPGDSNYEAAKPAYYTVENKTVNDNIRAAGDGGPRAGWADKNRKVTVGGFSGNNIDGTESSTTYTKDNNAEVHFPDGSVGTVSSIKDKEVTEWSTSDKPIYKVVVKTGHVKGYVEYWNTRFGEGENSSPPKVYLFGLGPYDKAQGDYDRGNTVGQHIGHDATDENGKIITEYSDSEQKQIDLTKKYDEARKTFNSALKSAAGGAKFIDIWDITLANNPYFRYGSVVDGKTSQFNSAYHGKWYDENTNDWIFHMMWSTILRDNPNEELPEAVDVSLYAAASSLTAYANKVLSQGRGTEGDDGEDSGDDDTGGADDADVSHSLDDIAVLGVSGAGAVLGYGDEEYGFSPFITTRLSDTSSYIDYASLIDTDKGMYQYARYGALLSNLGIDKSGTEEIMSPRLIPGILLSVFYMGNSALSVTWKMSFSLLKALNPFQLFANASLISAQSKSKMYSGDDFLVKLAQRHGSINAIFDIIGGIYDTLTGTYVVDATAPSAAFTDPSAPAAPVHTTQNLSITALYIIAFVVGFAFCYRRWFTHNQFWSKTRNLLVRTIFIMMGIPILGFMYTAALNGVSDSVEVTVSPSSQVVAATFVDFGGWVKTSRLAPPEGSVLESDASLETAGGEASADTVVKLRQTAWSVNKSTGVLGGVNMDAFENALKNDSETYDEWNGLQYERIRSDSPVGDGFRASSAVMGLIADWTSGQFYYSSDFGSETMADFSNRYGESVGYQEAPKEEGSEPTPTPTAEAADDAQALNDNTLFQMFGEINNVDGWTGRSVDDNKDIFKSEGKYGSGSLDGSDWSKFNIFANGAMTAAENGDLVSYDKNAGKEGSLASSGNEGGTLNGLKLDYNTGLSTLSMYNYLATDFRKSGMAVYSTAKAVNGHTAKAHYKVNMIGSGFMEIIFYFNCFAFLFAVVIIGFVYSIGMAIRVIKRGFSMIMAIPGALVGLLQSIAQVCVTVISMIAELFMSVFLYSLMSELLLVIVTLFEGPLQSAIRSIEAAGIMAVAGGYIQTGEAVYPMFMIGISVSLVLVSVKAAVKAKDFFRVLDLVLEYIFMKFILTREQAIRYKEFSRKKIKARNGFTKRFNGVLSGVLEKNL